MDEQEQRAQMPGTLGDTKPGLKDQTLVLIDAGLLEGCFHAMCSYTYGNGSTALLHSMIEAIAEAMPSLQAMLPRFLDKKPQGDELHLMLARLAYFSAGGVYDDPRRAQKVSKIQIAIRDAMGGNDGR